MSGKGLAGKEKEGKILTKGTVRLIAASVFLWTAAVPDLKTKRIPVWIPAACILTAIAGGLIPSAAADRQELWAGAVPGALLLILSLLSGGKIGEGDGVCLLICGLYTGFTKTILIAEIALLSAAAAGTVLLLTKRRRADDRLPFVPFLAAASTLILLYGLLSE